MTARIIATYLVRAESRSIEARARAIAVEQSVEMPVEAIEDARILDQVVGRVEAIEASGGGLFTVRIGLAAETVGGLVADAGGGGGAGQLLNMLFGNTSLQEDTALADLDLPAPLARAFGGPRHGLAGLRARVRAQGRALTCAAIKPQGLGSDALARIAARFAAGGLDFVKDDHGLGDHHPAPFAARVRACAEAVARAAEATGHPTRYVPSLSGDLDAHRRQLAAARDAGVDTVMVAPMIAGFATVQTLVRENPDLAFLAHPTLGGAARILPALLIGRLFRLIGADAVIFPTHGGRFGYSEATCRDLADKARRPWLGLAPSVPVPAGGITTQRIAEILEFYGPDTMLLIGGSLLAARERLTEDTAAFVRAVADHSYR